MFKGRWIHEERKCENGRTEQLRLRAGRPLKVALGRQINHHLGHPPKVD